MDTAVLAGLRELADAISAPKLLLYLGDRDVPDPWKQPGEAFTACVTVIEAGALRNLTGMGAGTAGRVGIGSTRSW